MPHGENMGLPREPMGAEAGIRPALSAGWGHGPNPAGSGKSLEMDGQSCPSGRSACGGTQGEGSVRRSALPSMLWMCTSTRQQLLIRTKEGVGAGGWGMGVR